MRGNSEAPLATTLCWHFLQTDRGVGFPLATVTLVYTLDLQVRCFRAAHSTRSFRPGVTGGPPVSDEENRRAGAGCSRLSMATKRVVTDEVR